MPKPSKYRFFTHKKKIFYKNITLPNDHISNGPSKQKTLMKKKQIVAEFTIFTMT